MNRLLSIGRVATLITLLALLQVTFVSQLRIAGVAPDLLLLAAVSAGVAVGPDRGAIVGFAAGLAYDVFLLTPLGLSALVYCVVAYVVGLFQLPLATHPRWWRAASATVASALGVAGWEVAALVIGQDQVRGVSVSRVIVVIALVNGLLSLPFLRVASWAFAPTMPKTAS